MQFRRFHTSRTLDYMYLQIQEGFPDIFPKVLYQVFMFYGQMGVCSTYRSSERG